MTALETALNYRFNDKGLLQTALTHSSYANEKRAKSCISNERLEFLGDSILGCVVAEHLYSAMPMMPEGGMTKLRAELVCEQSLVHVARELSIGGHLLLGRGEDSSGGRERPSILADAVEALIAAMYLDGGPEISKSFIVRHILDRMENTNAAFSQWDYKTRLQELIQKETGKTLSYDNIAESGPEHCKVFVSQALINGVPVGRGEGRSKKESEQAAAHDALKTLFK